MRTTMPLVIVLLLAGAAPAMAQQHPRANPPSGSEHQMPGGGMMGPGMGQGMNMGMGPLTRDLGPFAPSRLLGMANTLQLSAEQVERLRALVTESSAAEENAHAPARAAMQQLRKLLTASAPDVSSMRALFQAHHTAMGNVQWVRAEAALRARDVLTTEQRERVGAGSH